MIIQTVEADKELASIASSINQDPKSWENWSSIVFNIPEDDEDIKQDCLLWVKSLCEAYFFDTETRIYFSKNEDIHVLCKNIKIELMDNFIKQIKDMAKHYKVDNAIDNTVYFLGDNAQEYQDVIMQKLGKIKLDYADDRPVQQKGKEKAQDRFNLFGKRDPSFANDKVKLLLIEDDPVTTWMVNNALKEECEILSLGYANKVYATYGIYEPDIIFLDIGLPDDSGYEVLKWIKKNDPGALVVMFSSNDNLDNLIEALECGASGFIPKPFLKESLMYYVDNLIGASESRYG